MATRVMEILSTPNASMTVVLQDLGIEHGNATDGGHLGSPDALGGGILVDGGQVTLSGVDVGNNQAVGADGVLWQFRLRWPEWSRWPER